MINCVALVQVVANVSGGNSISTMVSADPSSLN